MRPTITNPSMDERLARILKLLDYQPQNGWLEASEFDGVSVHRFALTQAAQEMNVAGAFAWIDEVPTTRLVAPLVYVALAADLAEAKKIHRKVWSQGLVPFLIVLTPQEVVPLHGFQFSSALWEKSVSSISWSDVPATFEQRGQLEDRVANLLDYRAVKLRTSLFWRDRAIEVSGRVDQYLLMGLESLSDSLIKGLKVTRPLPPTAANGLIGRFLYVLFLVDRGIINQQWLNERGHEEISLADSNQPWSAASTWALLEDLDGIFNGSIFPLSAADRRKIDATHINLIRLVMRHGAKITGSGEVQLAFIDVDLGVMRIETLSAVYEQFLENIKSGERRQQGAYYTPPFLVDLVLDRVEETVVLRDGITVLDPAAGSGVFLVGAYRRILEHARTANFNAEMGLDEVRGLLQRNIYGVERNPDACHVAAFSLYLTMLDYVMPRDLRKVAAGHDPNKLFPSLVGTNLFAVDFFASPAAMPTLPREIHCVVGNPPWQTLKKLKSMPASRWATDHRESPIGNDQAAELFVWKSLRQHMAANGLLALLIPAKSFVNPTAYKFRKNLMTEFTIVGAVNFSHLRHRLFAGAKHACAALFVKNERPSPARWTWVYSPLSIGQPMPYKAWPWTLIVDRSEIQTFPHSRLAEDSRAWFEAFMLRPVDRQIRSFVQDRAQAGVIQLLGKFCAGIGASVKRGGSSVETGLESKFLEVESPPPSLLEMVSSKPRTIDLFEEPAKTALRSDRLPLAQLARVTATYKHQFSGHVLLVPRNFRDIRYLDYPKGFSSSFLAVYFEKAGSKTSPQERKVLLGLQRYLTSNTAQYFMATGGRRWLMDRSNVEPTDLQNFPVPFTSLEDPRLDKVLALEGTALENYLMRALGVEADYKLAIEEFLRFRIQFQDGDVPGDALERPSNQVLEKYADVMRLQLDDLMGRENAFVVQHAVDEVTGVGVVAARFCEADMPTKKTPDLCREAVIQYQQHAKNSFSDSLSIGYDSVSTAVSVVKPLEYFRWTIDSAYSDSRHFMNTFMKGAV